MLFIPRLGGIDRTGAAFRIVMLLLSKLPQGFTLLSNALKVTTVDHIERCELVVFVTFKYKPCNLEWI